MNRQASPPTCDGAVPSLTALCLAKSRGDLDIFECFSRETRTAWHLPPPSPHSHERILRRHTMRVVSPTRARVFAPSGASSRETAGARLWRASPVPASSRCRSKLLTSASRISSPAPAASRGESGSWDPDDRRRIEENRSWRRTDAPEDAWDIDKERDAVMYKRESLERLLSLTPKEQKPDRAVTCAACGAEVCRRSDETQKDKAHVHRQTYAGAYVSVSVYANAGGIKQTEDAEKDEEASTWWPPRDATRCRCASCDRSLGWRVADNKNETVGAFYALLTSRLAVGKPNAEP